MDVEDAYVNPYATKLVDPLVGQKIEEVRSSVKIDDDGHKVVTISVFVGMGWDWYDRVVVVQDDNEGGGDRGAVGDAAGPRGSVPQALEPAPGSVIESVLKYKEEIDPGRCFDVVSLKVNGKVYERRTAGTPPDPPPQPDPGLREFRSVPKVERGIRSKMIYEVDFVDGRTIWQIDLRKGQMDRRTGERPWREVKRTKFGVLVVPEDPDDDDEERARRRREPEPEQTEEEHTAMNAWFCRRDWCPIHQNYYR